MFQVFLIQTFHKTLAAAGQLVLNHQLPSVPKVTIISQSQRPFFTYNSDLKYDLSDIMLFSVYVIEYKEDKNLERAF